MRMNNFKRQKVEKLWQIFSSISLFCWISKIDDEFFQSLLIQFHFLLFFSKYLI